MCLTPITLLNGLQVGCRNCWQCQEQKKLDWVGRSFAELKTCKAAYSVTLTYGRDIQGYVDHPNALILTYSDVQKYLKRLLAAGHKVRYLVAGEYGPLKGRAHWHAILFFHSDPPADIILNKRFMQKHWKLGVSFWRSPHLKSFKYVCKYVMKNKDTEQIHLSMSKKPPIGAGYFRDLARLYVEQGLAPQTLHYKMDGAVNSKGRPLKFQMSGKTAENFLQEYVACWRRNRPGQHLPGSDLVEEYLDAIEPIDQEWQPDPNRWVPYYPKPLGKISAIEVNTMKRDRSEPSGTQIKIGPNWWNT